MPRRLELVLACALVAAVAGAARADATASAGLGAGAVADEAVGALDLGLDAAGARWAIGLGGRLRWSADGLRAADWDDTSERARVVRYALWTTAIADAEIALAAGELGDVTLGPGLTAAGYLGGVDADHGRLGAWLRVTGDRLAVDGVIDDVTGPRFAALRLARDAGDRRLGASAVVDWSLPTMADRRASAVVVALDGERMVRPGGVVGGFAELAGLVGPARGLGLGVGAVLRAPLGDGSLGLRLGAVASTAHFVPGWLGPLYELERRRLAGPDGMRGTLGDVVGAGGLDGVAPAASLVAASPELGALALGYLGRPGLADVASARLSLPHFRGLQAALSGAAAVAPHRVDSFALAGELRARLPARLYATAELSHLYYEQDGVLAPGWSALISVGAVMGEPVVATE